MSKHCVLVVHVAQSIVEGVEDTESVSVFSIHCPTTILLLTGVYSQLIASQPKVLGSTNPYRDGLSSIRVSEKLSSHVYYVSPFGLHIFLIGCSVPP